MEVTAVGLDMLKNLPKMLPGISQKISPMMLLSVLIMLLSCPQFLTLSWKTYSNDYFIKVFHYKVTVLLKSIDLLSAMQLSAFLQLEHFTDCSIRDYRSILDELCSVF